MHVGRDLLAAAARLIDRTGDLADAQRGGVVAEALEDGEGAPGPSEIAKAPMSSPLASLGSSACFWAADPEAIIRERFKRLSRSLLAAHGSTDARSAATHEAVGVASASSRNSLVALMVSSDRRERPSNHEASGLRIGYAFGVTFTIIFV